MDELNYVRFEDIEQFFKSEILIGDISACKRITIKTDRGDLILQVGDTDDHYYIDLINKPVETTNEQPKLTMAEFCAIREGLYKLKAARDFTSQNAMTGIGNPDNFNETLEKLRRLMV